MRNKVMMTTAADKITFQFLDVTCTFKNVHLTLCTLFSSSRVQVASVAVALYGQTSSKLPPTTHPSLVTEVESPTSKTTATKVKGAYL